MLAGSPPVMCLPYSEEVTPVCLCLQQACLHSKHKRKAQPLSTVLLARGVTVMVACVNTLCVLCVDACLVTFKLYVTTDSAFALAFAPCFTLSDPAGGSAQTV